MINKLKIYSIPLFITLYLAVHFLPGFGAADPIGFQWLYVSAFDFIVAVFILFNYSNCKEAVTGIFKFKFVIAYGLYFIWALASLIYAVNKTETLVCLARLTSTFLLFINLSVLFYKKDMTVLLKQIALIVAIVSFVDSLFLCIEFFWQLGQKPFDNIVLSLRSIAFGNKNIRAASVLIHIPFILYYIVNSKFWGKLFGTITLSLTFLALFILNTRSTFVGLLLIFLIYGVGIFMASRREGKKESIYQLFYFILPLIFSYLISNSVINAALHQQKGVAGYGTVAKRVSDITIEKGRDRLSFWHSGIDYAKGHILIGGGYGNWKLSSLIYEKGKTSNFVVRYHLHNDFIENFADLGIIGGLLFLGIFLLAFLMTLDIWRKRKFENFRMMATVSFMAITCYFIDAAFNFPVERTVMQVMFAISAAVLMAPFSMSNEEDSFLKSTKSFFSKTAIVLMIFLLSGAIIVNAMVYKSLRMQKYMMGDLGLVPVMTLEEVNGLPSIPNLSFNTMPLPAILARYYIKYKKFDQAYKLLTANPNANPYLHYNDFVKSQYFEALSKNDSALIYAKIAFYNWPTAQVYFNHLFPLTVKTKDSSEMTKAFTTYIQYNNQSNIWQTYLNARVQLMGVHDKYTIHLTDSALKQFPNDSIQFIKIRNTLLP